jgi:zinc finger SWIM domain-containing protein 3
MQNAVKHLHEEDNEEENKENRKEKKKEKKRKKKKEKEEENEETSVLSDFSACMFEYEDIAEFEEKFNLMRQKVTKQTWLDSIYKLKEKWAECYMKNVFTLGMRSTQLSESLNNDLKIHFKSDFDIIRFFKHFERVVQGKRNNELNSEFDSRKKMPKMGMMRPPPMLVQASKLYTPIIFEAFRGEYERSLAACTKALDGTNEYLVGDFTYEEEYKVVGDPLKETVVCSCRQFDRIGILCSHALKVLDLMNIKSLPPQYVLKRWTREARTITVQDNLGRNIIENPKMDAMLRLKYMSHKFLNLAQQAANSPECTMLVDNTLDILGKQLAEKVNTNTSTYQVNARTSTVQDSSTAYLTSLISASLKKKDVQTKSSKRKRTWLDKKHKFRKRRENKATSQFGEAGNNDVLHGQEAVSGGAQAQEGLCPLFPEPSNSSAAQEQAQGAFCPFFSEASNSSGTQAQAQVSFTQMLMVICS